MPFYPSIPAGDGTSLLAPANAQFEVFELTDTGFTKPLPLTTDAGLNAAPLVTTAQGVVPPVNVTSPNLSHIFKSGTWEWRRDSFDGAAAAVQSAQRDAAAAASDASEAASTAAAAATGLVEKKLLNGDLRGAPGKDGSNVLPTAQAIRQELTTPGGEVNEAFRATAERFVGPLVSQKITGDGLGKVYLKTDIEFPIENGESLWVIKTPEYFTDFSTQTANTPPAGWSTKWTPGTWTVVEDAKAPGGKVLRHVGTGGNIKRGLSWDEIPTSKNAELVYQWRANQNHTNPRAVIRGAGLETNETGFYGGHSHLLTGPLGGLYSKGATAFTANGTNKGFTANKWYRTRLRAQDSTFYVRTWAADSPEPEGWDVKFSNVNVPDAGWLGLLAFGADTVDVAFVGVSTGGGRAPTARA